MSCSNQAQFWHTAISQVEPGRILLRGYSIAELMGRRSFGDIVYLAFIGELPERREGTLIEAILVACVDHGLHAPSVNAARFVASSGVPIQAAVASGINAIGEVHGGSIEASARLLQENADLAGSPGERARRILAQYKEADRRLPGFGHPIHQHDPRSVRLFDLARELGHFGKHCELTEELSTASGDFFRKPLTINVDGVVAALMSDLSIPWYYGKGFFIIARSVGLIAHVVEEIRECPPFRKVSLEEVSYRGKPYRPLPPYTDQISDKP